MKICSPKVVLTSGFKENKSSCIPISKEISVLPLLTIVLALAWDTVWVTGVYRDYQTWWAKARTKKINWPWALETLTFDVGGGMRTQVRFASLVTIWILSHIMLPSYYLTSTDFLYVIMYLHNIIQVHYIRYGKSLFWQTHAPCRM